MTENNVYLLQLDTVCNNGTCLDILREIFDETCDYGIAEAGELMATS
jgi:hypothetical protein